MEWIFPLLVILVPVVMIATSDYDIERHKQGMRELDEIIRKTIYKK